MPDQAQWKIGRITKPYGIKGKVQLTILPLQDRHIQLEIPLFIELDGQRIPFFLEEWERISPDQAVVKFEFIQNMEDARTLSGCDVYFQGIPGKVTGKGSEDFHRLVGYTVIDHRTGLQGHIVDYLFHESNPVFVLNVDNREILVPATRDLILQIDPSGKVVHFSLPDGLTSL